MKNKKLIMTILIIVIIIVVSIIVYQKLKFKEVIDENELYVEKFDDYYLRFERYDYVLGQNMLVGVEKSFDGKHYERISLETLQVSNESKFKFLNEKVMFVISTKYLSKNRDYKGFKVSVDGGKTFIDAKFIYENNCIENIEINNFPYVDGNNLKLIINFYDINGNGSGYKNYEIEFISTDSGLTWNVKK